MAGRYAHHHTQCLEGERTIELILLSERTMQSNAITKEEEPHLLPPKKDLGLRRVYSDASYSAMAPGNGIIVQSMEPSDQARTVECECCGMSEECTPTYISRIKEFFTGKWVCGICSEAVKEKMRRSPAMALEEAVEAHMSFCKQFNGTIRLNPKLYLAGAMRDIARKSSQRRRSMDACSPKSIARTVSCGSRMDVETIRGSFQ